MHKELKILFTWFKANKLSTGADKIKWTISHTNSKNHFIPAKFPGLFIDFIILEWEIKTKFLRLIIDENVTWKSHINIISTKISKTTGSIPYTLIEQGY